MSRAHFRALASARGSVARRAQKHRRQPLEGPRVAGTRESEGPKGPRTSKAQSSFRRLPVLVIHPNSTGTVAALSRHSRGTVAALSRHCGGTLAALWRHSRGTVAALSRHCGGTLVALWRHSHAALSWQPRGTVMALSCLPPAKLVSAD